MHVFNSFIIVLSWKKIYLFFHLRKKKFSARNGGNAVIPALWEIEARGFQVQDWSGQLSNLTRFCLKNKNKTEPRMQPNTKGLGSNPSTEGKKKNTKQPIYISFFLGKRQCSI